MGNVVTSFGGEDRRLHERFDFDGDAMVFLGKDTGTILNLSRSGLAARITAPSNTSLNVSSLDIFFAEPRFYLPDLPVQVVNESPIYSNSMSSIAQVKRLGLKFGSLGKQERDLLDQFIDNHACLAKW